MPREKASRFVGVHPRRSARFPWTAQIVIPSGKVASFGSFRTERQAAEAYDRAVLYYRGPDARRNFPDEPLTPADEATLRAEVRRRAKAQASSKYRGVVKDGVQWQATISLQNRGIFLGSWRTERQAAEAFDQAAHFFGRPRSHLNFRSRRLNPLCPPELRRLAYASFKTKTSSKYRGVLFVGYPARPWLAQIGGVGPGRKHLGTWASEKDAACAYDRAARFYVGPGAKLNFPTDDLEPADATTLMMEARREAKRALTSRYLGVSWLKSAGRWQAVILHSHRRIHLGFYADERAAAQAYDASSIELRGPRARVNFHPVTGKHVWGTRLGELTPLMGDRSGRKASRSRTKVPSPTRRRSSQPKQTGR